MIFKDKKVKKRLKSSFRQRTKYKTQTEDSRFSKFNYEYSIKFTVLPLTINLILKIGRELEKCINFIFLALRGLTIKSLFTYTIMFCLNYSEKSAIEKWMISWAFICLSTSFFFVGPLFYISTSQGSCH